MNLFQTELNDTELEEVEKFAKLHFTPEQIVVILGKVTNAKNSVYLAYQKGRLLQEAKVREKIFQLAENGSGPEIVNAMRIIRDLKTDLELDYPEYFID